MLVRPLRVTKKWKILSIKIMCNSNKEFLQKATGQYFLFFHTLSDSHSTTNTMKEEEEKEEAGLRKNVCVSFDLIFNEIILSSTTNGENRNKKAFYY